MTSQFALRIATAAVVLAGIGYALAQRESFEAGGFEAWITGFGPWAPIVFIGVYAAATVMFLPGSILTLAGGALFGPLWGGVYSLTGATAGAVIAFLVARYLFSDWLMARGGRRYRRVIEGVEQEGWRFVAMTRLLPFVPFNLLNYALGLSRIRTAHYVATTVICMVPGAAGYAWLGYAGRAAIAGEGNWIEIGLYVLGALALVVFLPRFIKRLRRGAPSPDGGLETDHSRR